MGTTRIAINRTDQNGFTGIFSVRKPPGFFLVPPHDFNQSFRVNCVFIIL